MLTGNPFFQELEKIANTEVETAEPMNPDQNPVPSEEELAAAKAQNVAEEEEVKAQEEAAIAQAVAEAQAPQTGPTPEEQAAIEAAAAQVVSQPTATEVPGEAGVQPQVVANPDVPLQIPQEVAEQLPEYGAIAKLVDLSQSGDAPVDVQKVASERLALAMTDFESYVEVISKTANELFGDEENLNELHSPEGLEFIQEKLSSFVEKHGMDKEANEGGGFANKVVGAVSNFMDSMKNLGTYGAEIEKANSALQVATNKVQELSAGAGLQPGYHEAKDIMVAAGDKLSDLRSQQRMANAGLLGGIALAGTGAYAGGKKLYDTMQNNQEQLNPQNDDDKLEAGKQNQNTGGTERMANNKQLVKDFLKVAGAAGLISITNDEGCDMELRKQASDRFNEISRMGRSEMDENLVKVAQELYNEEELTSIVAGNHTQFLLDKVANVLAFNEMSADELEKVANAEGVAAKGVAGALTDAASNIQATIKEDKKQAEAEGREYVGDTDKSGKVGGELVGGTEGYKVINNPGKYQVDKTAQELLEEAVMMKQAAQETLAKADEFIKIAMSQAK